MKAVEEGPRKRERSLPTAGSVVGGRHLSGPKEYMTPSYIVEPVRKTLGQIDLDPATSPEANQEVRASRIFAREDDGLAHDWGHPDNGSRVLLNPPGSALRKAETIGMKYGYTRSRQALWWSKLMCEWEQMRIKAAIFIGFSIEILQVAQSLRCDVPSNFPLCVPRDRIPFDEWIDGRRCSQEQPTHGNVIVCVTTDPTIIKRFRANFRKIGEVFNVVQ